MTETSNDQVPLLIGEHDVADGAVMARASMPTDAFRTAANVKLSAVAYEEIGGTDRDLRRGVCHLSGCCACLAVDVAVSRKIVRRHCPGQTA